MKLKKNDLKELTGLNLSALQTKLQEAKLELQSFRVKRFKVGEVKDLHAGKQIRRAIAQLNTLIGKIKE